MQQKITWLFAQECKFIAGAAVYSAIPNASLPEIAFVGRSNVGKSSLINCITNRNSLARVSHTPGSTKQINFFALGNYLSLVDLPGYGYAKVSRGQIKGWSKLIKDYLKARPNLKRVCLLIDSRHLIKEVDVNIMKLLDDIGLSYQIVLTKTDDCKQSDLKMHTEAINKIMIDHPSMHPHIISTSSRRKHGMDELKQELFNFAVNID